MSTLLITGGAGFIGSNLVRHALAHTADRLVVVDKLTYAGSLANLEGPLDGSARDVRPRGHRRSRLDDADLRRASARGGRQPGGRDARRSIHRQPPRLHRHERRRHLRAARGARRAFARGERGIPLSARVDRRGVRHARRERPVQRGDAVRAELAVRREQGVGRSSGARVLPHLRPAGDHHQLFEQLRAVPVSGEAHPADDPERGRRTAAADLRRRRQRARLAARRGSLRRPAAGAGQRASGREVQYRRRQRAHEPARSWTASATLLDRA